MKLRIISGGQTGADLAGLWVGKILGLPTGGTAPFDFLTQKGNQPGLANFGLKDKGDYRQRTIQNVRDSDVTLIFSKSMGSAGTILTKNSCARLLKQCFAIQDNRDDQSLRSYWGNIENGSAQVWTNALKFLCDKASKQHALGITDEYFTINVAGNSTKKTTPEAFDFAFVGLWYMLMLYHFHLKKIGAETIFPESATQLDPIELAKELRDQFTQPATFTQTLL